jgi:RNA polymerase sigma factor (sigma-70 family)
MSSLLHHLRRIILAKQCVGLTDGELLDGFVVRRDGAYFEALVRRHGPMVLGVCRRVLRDHHDAEDAFQAAFLVLARRAAAVPRAAVGNWLYGVAYRTALGARRAAARRRARQRSEDAMPHPTTGPAEDWAELRPLLDAELSRLPDRYRSAVVLCDLEGLTRAEAARQLGVPEGTVSGRLTTARRMLADRLARRGVTLSAAALGALLGQGVAAAVPTPLVAATVQAGEALAGGTAAGVVAPQVTALADGVARGLGFARWKPVLLVWALALPAAGGVAVVAVGEPEKIAPPDPPAVVSPRPEPTARERLQGEWRIVKAESDGESVLDPGFRGTRFVFAGERFVYRTNNRDREGKYQLDAALSPAILTLSLGEDAVMACIFEVTDRQLKVCWRKLGPRPVAFDTTRERDVVLFILDKQ